MSSVPKFAVIGCGGIGNVHRACIAELENRKQVRLEALADPFPARYPLEAASLADAGKRWYVDYREMLERESLDVVVIAAPIHLHFEMVRAALATGARVLLEKPPVPLSAQLEDLIAQDQQARVWTSFQMIHTSAIQQVKALVSSGALGEIRHIRACGFWSRKTAYYQRAPWAGKLTLHGAPVFDGPATNALAHLLHNALYLATPEPGFTLAEQVEAEFYRVRPIESYDVVSLRARLAGGVQFTAAFTHAVHQNQPFFMEITGSLGSARIEEGAPEAITRLPLPFRCKDPGANPFQILYRDFAAYLRDGRDTPRTLLADSRGYVRLTNAALISSGGIHDVPASFTETAGHGIDLTYTVPGLDTLLAEAVRTGRLLSELDISWAVPGLPAQCAPDLDAEPLMCLPRLPAEAAA